MNNKLVLLVLGILLLSLCSAYAGNSGKIGTAGATELLIPVGARGSSLGGAVIADPRGVESMYWNPAGLALMQGTELAFSHQPYLADIDVNWGAVATSIEGFGSIGVSAKIISIGNIEETTELQPEGTGNIYNPTLAVVGVSYARTLTANVAVGATAMLIDESIFKVSATGVAFDFGVIYDPRWKGVKFGMTIKNYGPNMSFGGAGFDLTSADLGTRDVRSQSAAFELPSHIDLGASCNFMNRDKHALTASGVFRSNNFQDDMYQGGLEYSYNDRYFLRGGYNYSNQQSYIYGASFGAGLSVPVGGSKLTFEYTWTQTKVFTDNQYFTLKVGF
jgi:long-subunit fatty acid transport protein